MRRYETLWDRELYTYLPGPVIDQITKMSGSLAGIETVISIVAAKLDSNPAAALERAIDQQAVANPFDYLYQELDDLFTILKDERSKLVV